MLVVPHEGEQDMLTAFLGAEELLLKENAMQHLAGYPHEIRGVVEALNELSTKVSKAAKPLLRDSSKA